MKTPSRIAGVLFTTLIALAIVGCTRSSSESAATTDEESPSPAAQVARIDKAAEEIVASDAKFEARQWLKQANNVFFKENKKEVAKLVEEFYGAGATQVLIGQVEEIQGNNFAGAVVVVLPKDAAQRTKLFEIGDRADTLFQDDPVTDKGQNYLYFVPD